MRFSQAVLVALIACAVSACGGDKNDSADRQSEAQKAVQEGMQKEKAMYEGMQKGVQDFEKKGEAGSQENKK